MKSDSRISRRLREVAQLTEEEKAKFAGVSVIKWNTMLRAEKRELLVRAVRKEK